MKKQIIHQMFMRRGGAAGPTYETPSYSHALGSGARVGLNSKFTTSGAGWNSIGVDAPLGAYNDGSYTSAGIVSEGVDCTDARFIMDFTGQASPTYKADKIKFYFAGAWGGGGSWKVRAYISAAWVDVSSNFVLYATAPQEIALTGAEGFTMLDLIGVSGVHIGLQWQEVEFSIGGEA
jgi:hypothetical protein